MTRRIRRLVDTDDLSGITELIHRAYAPLAARGLRYWATHQTVEDTANRYAQGEGWLAEVEGRVVGTVTLHPQDRPQRVPFYARPDVAKFSQLCVDPDHQGGGVGAALMSHVEDRARELGAQQLACDTSVHANDLIRRYELRGYRFVGHADYRPHVNYRSVLLALRLDGSQRTPTLRTERLVLRAAGLRDAPAIQEHFGTWAVIRHLSRSVPWPYPTDGARRFLEDTALPAVERGEQHVWVIALRQAPDDAIGIVNYHPNPDPAAGGDRGFWLGEPWWGRGIMTEAVEAVQDYLFFEVGLDRIVVTNSIDNVGSRRVKEKTGARKIGTCTFEHHEGAKESETWEITQESWRAHRGS